MNDEACPGEQERLQALHGFDILDTGPEEAFEGIVRLARSVLQVPIALVSLVDQDRQWFKARLGLDDPQTSRDVSFCAHAIVRDEPMVVVDALSDPRFASNPLVTGKPHIRFYIGAQLRTNNGFNLGTVCCIDTIPRRPSPDQVSILCDLARLAVDELELRKLAYTDGLTGALTRRAFLEAGRRDFALARRHRRPLSCVMVDVDHFKRVNDSHGHAMGDQVLRRLVSLFRSELRASDYIGRLGGEEFGLVLRETDRDGAYEIADRLRRLLAQDVFPTLADTLRITASCGVAEDGGTSSFDALLAQADKALYQAKSSGRNRTMVHAPAPSSLDPSGGPLSLGPAADPAPARMISAQPMTLACRLLQGDRSLACTLTSHYNGVLQGVLECGPDGARNGRVSLSCELTGRFEGDLLWVGERQFALLLVGTPKRRAELEQAFAKWARAPAARLTAAA